MATLRDVARAAGVSPATVSRVLNGNQQVAPELRERVQQAAVRVGYQLANLRRPRTVPRQVGLIVPHVSSPFYCEVLAGVEREAFQRGYDLIFLPTQGRRTATSSSGCCRRRRWPGWWSSPRGTGKSDC